MSNFSFTKLFSSITESTIWAEANHVRIVWITMLAMADRQGRVYATIPGLAGRARVSVEECEEALTKFLSPDKYSRSKDHEGRRIEDIDGGWLLLNYERYRALRDHEADKEKKRKWAKKSRAQSRLATSNVDHGRPEETEVDPGRPKTEDRRQKTEGSSSPSEKEDASHLLAASGGVAAATKQKGAYALYRELWQERYGHDPHPQQKDIIAAQTALKPFSPEQRESIIRAFVADDDKWLVEKAHRLGLLPSQIDRLLARANDLEVAAAKRNRSGLSPEFEAQINAENQDFLRRLRNA